MPHYGQTLESSDSQEEIMGCKDPHVVLEFFSKFSHEFIQLSKVTDCLFQFALPLGYFIYIFASS